MTFVAITDKAAGDQVTLAMHDALKDNFNAGVMRPIAHTALTGTSASVTLSSIATDWVDLLLLVRVRSSAASTQGVRLRVNADTGTNYGAQWQYWDATPAVACSASDTITSIPLGTGPASTDSGFLSAFVFIPNYKGTTGHKAFSWRSFGWPNTSVPSGETGGSAGRYGSGYWASTAAISSINLFPSADSFGIGSTFTLFGISGV